MEARMPAVYPWRPLWQLWLPDSCKWPSDGIGRHDGFKIRCLRAWRFESALGYQRLNALYAEHPKRR